MGMREIVLIAHNIRSTHNVGSLLRTAEGLGVKTVYLTGYTPFPLKQSDPRLPHLVKKVDKQISKTALGAEQLVNWQHEESVNQVIKILKADGFSVCALEQTAESVNLTKFETPEKVAILVGREVEGIEPEVLRLCDKVLEIPMFGKKESFNVAQAAAMAMFYCRFG